MNGTDAASKRLMFEKGEKKLAKDLDIVNMVKMIHGFDVLRSVLFNRKDNFLL